MTRGGALNFYKRHIGDYLRDTAHLSLLDHGVYCRLLDVYYTRESAIPDDQAARLIGARSKAELAAVARVLAEFFTLDGDLWAQTRCEDEIAATGGKAEKNREVGKLGGRPRKETMMVSDNNHDGFKTEPTNNPSQTPDSRLQTPDNSKTLAPGKSLEGARASRLPPNWTLPDEWATWAKAEKPEWTAGHVRAAAERFRDYWIAKPGKDGTKLDWQATWRNWVRNERPGNGAPAGSVNGMTPYQQMQVEKHEETKRFHESIYGKKRDDKSDRPPIDITPKRVD